MAKEYEVIEDRIQRAVCTADKNCRKVRRGNIQFSPMQKQLMGVITVLKQLKLRQTLKGKPNRPRTRRIQRMITKYKYTGTTSFQSVGQIEEAILNATYAYAEFKKRAQDCRWEYINEIATELNEIDGKGKKHHFKILQRQELTKEYF
mmetsp:Transcript_14154/g.26578  ORF Transcript_14154/g.26578 Transcript_14154/m.26578 type:complete len:148 (+) Transcript_14154:1427-1870(+)